MTGIRDRAIEILENGMRTVFAPQTASRESPAANAADAEMSDDARKHAAELK